MNSYTLRRSPPTVSTAAGFLMLGYTALVLQAQFEAIERSSDNGGNSSTLKSGWYSEGGESPTLGASLFETAPSDGNRLFHNASEAFAETMNNGMQSLGSEFSAVIEESFWDLVLR
jgi:hypothetical protein